MDLEKILEMLQANKLDEATQKDIKSKLTVLIESKAQELMADKIDEELSKEKERLTEELEEKFETYKEDVTSKFSNFVDSILEEEIQIPEKVVEYARLGEMYQDLVEQFKIRLAIDEGALNDEVQSLLKEAKDEIVNLKEEVNELTKQNLEFEKDAQEMAAHIYLRKKCDGLTESQKTHVISILGDEVVKENIDKKFDIIVESLGVVNEEEEEDDNTEDDKGDVKTYTCPECGATAEVKEGDSIKCPECGANMKLEESSDGKEQTNEGRGSVEVPSNSREKDTLLNENKDTVDPWDMQKALWLEAIKSNRI